MVSRDGVQQMFGCLEAAELLCGGFIDSLDLLCVCVVRAVIESAVKGRYAWAVYAENEQYGVAGLSSEVPLQD